MSRLYHVTSSSNRASIDSHGLDWTRMGPAPGIAGSTRPEAAGIFVCLSEHDAGFFVRINNTGGPVDVWAIDGIDDDLVETGTGFCYVPRTIPRRALTLIERELPSPSEARSDGDGAFTSELAIGFDEDPRAPKPGGHRHW